MTTAGTAIAAFAESFNGAKYVYGGTSPTTGWDCSGFVQYVYKHFGINLPRTSEQQWAATQHVSSSNLAPGDLVFAQFPGDNASPGHVGIYIGNGKVISAQDPALGTGISTLQSWGNAIVGYGRPSGTISTPSTSTSSGLGGLLGIPSQITDFFSQADTLVKALMWLAQPSSWVRIGAFIAGVALLLFAIHALIAAAKDEPLVKMPTVVPVPI
jgi:hypothetical protein